jgi:hypothetical protein
LRIKLFQQVFDLFRQLGQATGGGAVGKGRIHPQMTEHLLQVRLTAAVEAVVDYYLARNDQAKTSHCKTWLAKHHNVVP